MRDHYKFLSLAILLGICSAAQEIPNSPKQATVGQLMRERDEGKEDQIAKLFEVTRANAKLPRLARIKPRGSLKQTVCTIALADKLPNILWFPTNRMSAFYKTVDPDSVSVELNKIASFDEARSPRPARYSIVVWRVSNEKGESNYWVGVQLYWSVEWQFFGNYFTDDIEYRNDWKKGIAPSCRGK